MNTKHLIPSIIALALFISVKAQAQGPPRLSVRPTDAGIELSWPAAQKQPDGTLVSPYFELQRSADLRQWQPVGERMRGAAAAPGDVLRFTATKGAGAAFYRLLAIQPFSSTNLGTGGAEVFGYGNAFAAELQRIGQISPDQFAAAFPTPTNYLPGISWDPTSAQFWNLFSADPAVVNTNKQWGDPGYRYFDSRLNAAELGVLKTNGFVVSERLSSSSFADLFYKLWKDDLPVFISTDAILQAWHRTYDAILEETEETYLMNSVQTILDGMASQLTAASAQVGNGVLKDSLLDADYFLAVARSLLAGTNTAPVPSLLRQDPRVAETLTNIQAEQLQQVDDFMGFCRVVDFSQFKVRGHYTHTERLGRYFQCMMWLGRIDIPVAGGPFERCPNAKRFASPRELGMAIVLWHLLNQSGKFASWAAMEQIIETFVGWTDSMTFGQLDGLLAGAGIRTLADMPDLATLQKLQADIVAGALGVQNIRSDWFEQPLSGALSYALPQTFTVFGQKFVPDSWAFSQTVFESILWVENGVTNKVQRRVPGALDAAFAILGNNQVVPELVAQMKGTFQDSSRPHALKWRDAKPYQHNLAAVRAVMDQQTTDAWESNIYMSWLACLRELSAPSLDPKYPESMRTHAWAMKTLNTQLASWTQLRHDTILYAKQSYTGWGQCVYPKGFVEPQVGFWQRLGSMANLAASLVSGLPYQGTYLLTTNEWQITDPSTGESNLVATTISVPLPEIQTNQVAHLRRFADTVAMLQTLSEKELAQACFSSDEELFIRNLIQILNPGGSGSPRTYTGWYPRLFYRTIYWTDDVEFHKNYGADAPVALVADVHTDVPDLLLGDPGSVLHEAIGRVNLLMLAVDNGGDRFVCAGPVLSHYELEVIGDPRRLSDDEMLGITGDWWGCTDPCPANFPPDVPASHIEGLAPPVWTRSYLMPTP